MGGKHLTLKELARREQVAERKALISALAEQTGLRESTIFDLLGCGWHYKEETGKPASWVSVI